MSIVQADLQVKHQAKAALDFSWLFFQVFKEYPANFLDSRRFRLG